MSTPTPFAAGNSKGKIRVLRTPGGKRRILESEIRRVRGEVRESRQRVLAIYGRMSSHEQRGSDIPAGRADGCLLAIVTSFAGKLYGLRSHKKARELGRP